MAKQPVFIALTILGNLVIFGAATLLYQFENGINPNVHSYLDALWWAVATVTTVGFGDIVPITFAGRILGMCTIFVGAALFWSYTALFAEAILSRDFDDFESRLKDFHSVLKALSESKAKEQTEIRNLLASIQNQIQDDHGTLGQP